MDLSGELNAGTSLISVSGSQPGQSIGLNDTKAFTISSTELSRISCIGINMYTTLGAISVGSIPASSSATVHTVSLISTSIELLQPVSVYAMTALATTGIVIEANMTSSVGHLSFNSDSDSTGGGDLQVSPGLVLDAATQLVVSSSSGQIIRGGSLTLQSANGITLAGALSGGSGQYLILNADSNTDGSGTLSIDSAASLETNSGPLIITAWDLDVLGSVSTGVAGTTIHPSVSAQTISLGSNSLRNMHIEDSELGWFTTSALTVGNQNNGDISVGGVSDSNTDSFGTLSLLATKQNARVEFDTDASYFNKGIVVISNNGMHFSQNATFQATNTFLDVGTGTLTVEASKMVSTAGQLLQIVANDLHLEGGISTTDASTQCCNGFNEYVHAGNPYAGSAI